MPSVFFSDGLQPQLITDSCETAGTKMNELRGRKVQKIESPIPGCLGKMVNLFDLGTAVNGNKLLTDKPHRDGNDYFPLLTGLFTSQAFCLVPTLCKSVLFITYVYYLCF